ncbi:MAG TPA: GNAT family N-acetyltransferase [Steroidobacteraceae bacterium]|nr:GNAT family N-acetyltransferase [Steroidobacteraceae bacterium]
MESPGPKLELAQIGDAPLIAAMSCQLVESGLAPSWPAERVARHIRHAESVVLAAKHTGRLAGFAIMQFGDSTAHLNLLAVDPSSQRHGLGRALVHWLEESALVAGTFVIQLELRASNCGALAFYLRLGYRETGRVSGYYQRVEDAIQMSRDVRVPGGHAHPRVSGA